MAEDARYEPCDRVDDERGAKFATAQNKIANGNFVVNQMFRNPFIDSFVSAADEQDFVEFAPAARRSLIEQTALRREKSDLLIVALFRNSRTADSLRLGRRARKSLGWGRVGGACALVRQDCLRR